MGAGTWIGRCASYPLGPTGMAKSIDEALFAACKAARPLGVRFTVWTWNEKRVSGDVSGFVEPIVVNGATQIVKWS
jgi:hypothetical protein